MFPTVRDVGERHKQDRGGGRNQIVKFTLPKDKNQGCT